ncbi:MAG: peptidylprolyl isomerase [Phycisphaerales bacterium]|nr:peptidylprolyl isomerase [Phycisphaerales bacterium]
MKSSFIIVAVALGITLAACGSDGPGMVSSGPRPGGTSGVPAPASGTPVLVVNGESLGWEALVAPLGEAGGGPVVEELVLTTALRREFIKREWTLTPEDLEAERRAYGENLEAQGTAAPPGTVVDGVRRARGLGPARFAGLIERNAMLRRMVRDEVAVSAEEVELATVVRYGPKVRARLIVVDSERAAGEIRSRLQEAGAELTERFSLEAKRQSVDSTGPAGGVNEPVSPQDPSLPVAMRRALAETPVGTVSAVIGLERTWALVLPEERIDGVAIDPAAVRPVMEREVRLRKERIAMEEVARRLVESASVTVFDASLRYGWEGRRRR